MRPEAREQWEADKRVLAFKPRIELTCYCCGTKYQKGQFRCCAPPSGMASHNWLEQFHENCPNPLAAGPGKHRCPQHCGCQRDRTGRVQPQTAEEMVALLADLKAMEPPPTPQRRQYAEGDEEMPDDPW